MTFAEIGLIDLAESHIGVRRYDPNPDKHHHIHCIACGAIFDFTYGGYDRLDVPDEIANVFDILSKKIVLNAVCPECLKKSMLPPPAEPENAEAGGEESME
jgi:Fur family peroxide stress response transcriptional regulator